MQTNRKFGFLAVPLVATTLLSSCILPGFDDQLFGTSHRDGYRVHDSIPDSRYGEAYYYRGRYYTGGDYQAGRFTHNGRRYTNRYFYNGAHMYGGRFVNLGDGQQADPRHDTYRNRYPARY